MFNFTQEHLDKVRHFTAEVNQKQAQLEEKLSHLPKQPQLGDIFLFDNPKTMGLQWAIVDSHIKDNNWWLTVPADDYPLIGSTDIAISKKALCSPLTLRFGQNQGLWIHKRDFDINSRVGVLEEWDQERAFDKVEQIRADKIKNSALQAETDIDPEYEEWMATVNQGQQALMQEDSSVLAVPKSPILMPLSQWFKSKYINAISELETIFMPPPALAVASCGYRNPQMRKRSQNKIVFEEPINLGKELALVTDLEPNNEQIHIKLTVEATGEAKNLPKGLEIQILSDSGEIFVAEKTETEAEQVLGTEFDGDSGEHFNLKITLGTAEFMQTVSI